MYLFLKGGSVVSMDEVVGVFDLEGTSASQITREYIAGLTGKTDVIYDGEGEPRSYVVCTNRVFITPTSVNTIKRRLKRL